MINVSTENVERRPSVVGLDPLHADDTSGLRDVAEIHRRTGRSRDLGHSQSLLQAMDSSLQLHHAGMLTGSDGISARRTEF